MKYSIESINVKEHTISITGWSIENDPKSIITYQIIDKAGQRVDAKIITSKRNDVSYIYFKKMVDHDLGFNISFICEHKKVYYLIIKGKKKTIRLKVSDEIIDKKIGIANPKVQKIVNYLNIETACVAYDFMRENGVKALFLKSLHSIEKVDNEIKYGEWVKLTSPTKEELEVQKKEIFKYMPKFSVVTPVYKTPKKYLEDTLDSVIKQSYSNWELCIADGSPFGEELEGILEKYIKKDSRIKYKVLGKNLGISGNTNEALKMANGDFVCLMDHDDILAPNALFECAKRINENKDCDVLYSDEDKVNMDGDIYFDPYFKPDYNIDLLTSNNYICHLFVVKKELLDKVGCFQSEYDGAQDYDFILRCTEKAKQICHIPMILYHWRSHQDSTASNPESKLYAYTAGARAIMDHYKRVGIEALKVVEGISHGIYHTYFKIKDNPLVSIIIPNKDHIKDLNKCIYPILTKATYKNIEIIIVENNSTEKSTFDYYNKIEKEFSNVHVVYWEKEFNYSSINNFGVKYAKGEYLLFMNNDIELIANNFIEEMLGYAQREDVGVVGTRLLYGDDTIQHAGVIVGFGGVAGHAFVGIHKAENTYFNRAMCVQDYSAVTAACMMSKRSIFDKVGGFSEELAIAFNDIDYCLKVRKIGKLVVYNPYAELYHYESKSRGLEDTPEKIKRFNKEIAIFAKRWPDILKNGDPYYNPNLTLKKSNFALRDLKTEKIGEPYKLEVTLDK